MNTHTKKERIALVDALIARGGALKGEGEREANQLRRDALVIAKNNLSKPEQITKILKAITFNPRIYPTTDEAIRRARMLGLESLRSALNSLRFEVENDTDIDADLPDKVTVFWALKSFSWGLTAFVLFWIFSAFIVGLRIADTTFGKAVKELLPIFF